ncbi:unnamed protein product, partial [Brassica oleracea var. botrytis]
FRRTLFISSNYRPCRNLLKEATLAQTATANNKPFPAPPSPVRSPGPLLFVPDREPSPTLTQSLFQLILKSQTKS